MLPFVWFKPHPASTFSSFWCIILFAHLSPCKFHFPIQFRECHCNVITTVFPLHLPSPDSTVRRWDESPCRRRDGDNRMIHSLSKEVTASCAFYDTNLGFPRCTRWRAASQASQLAYRISCGVDKAQTPHNSLSWTQIAKCFLISGMRKCNAF